MENHLHISSKVENITHAENLVDQISEEHSLSSEIYGNMLVSVIEAVNNAIQHGNKNIESKYVDIYCTVTRESVLFRVIDQGTGFDFKKIPDPTKPENLEKPNGRGIFLMNHLADKVTFDDQGREVQLKFNLK